MKNSKILIGILSLFLAFGLMACELTPSNGYTVTWQNADGEVLEIDYNVASGTLPSYNGANPTKAATDQATYNFIGWTPELKPVTANITYKAVFEEVLNTYTVTWQNGEGEVLEVDNDVLYGTIPTYDGEIPTKPVNGNITYKFMGWTPNISAVISDITYVACFSEITDNFNITGVEPTLSEDGKTLIYGLYPQTHINDEGLIAVLNTLSVSDYCNWYLYENTYYAKLVANTYNNESYLFDDQEAIVNGNTYWFKCEPIEWQVIANDKGTYKLLAKDLLDVSCYYRDYESRIIAGETVYANNYEHSDLRSWLNNEFYNTAFKLNSAPIINVDDKVSILSYADALNADYGFATDNLEKSATRYAKVTDYARCKGAWCNTKTDLGTGALYNGVYWTKTASNTFYYAAWVINSGGYLSEYTVSGNDRAARPVIVINLY